MISIVLSSLLIAQAEPTVELHRYCENGVQQSVSFATLRPNATLAALRGAVEMRDQWMHAHGARVGAIRLGQIYQEDSRRADLIAALRSGRPPTQPTFYEERRFALIETDWVAPHLAPYPGEIETQDALSALADIKDGFNICLDAEEPYRRPLPEFPSKLPPPPASSASPLMLPSRRVFATSGS